MPKTFGNRILSVAHYVPLREHPNKIKIVVQTSKRLCQQTFSPEDLGWQSGLFGSGQYYVVKSTNNWIKVASKANDEALVCHR